MNELADSFEPMSTEEKARFGGTGAGGKRRYSCPGNGAKVPGSAIVGQDESPAKKGAEE